MFNQNQNKFNLTNLIPMGMLYWVPRKAKLLTL